jgi:hypothetical protein
MYTVIIIYLSFGLFAAIFYRWAYHISGGWMALTVVGWLPIWIWCFVESVRELSRQ